MNKTKEKKINLIKSEMEDIKTFMFSNKNLDISEQLEDDIMNNSINDTITLTNIIKTEEKSNNNSDLSEIKKELEELKTLTLNNEDLLRKILLKIK